jgi:hypothetical protein
MISRLLAICPSRNRPKELARMLESFDGTQSGKVELIIYIADDDPCLEDYRLALKNRQFIIGPRIPLVQVLNRIACKDYPGFEYYQEVNDDHVYRTQLWDKFLIKEIEEKGKGWGLACGNDLMTNEPWEIARHPSAAIISGNIVRTLGHFVWPELDHLGTDTYLRDIAEGIGAYYRRADIVIEHRHWLKGVAMDDNYRWVYSQDQWRKSYQVLTDWKSNHATKEIDKIKQARGF